MDSLLILLVRRNGLSEQEARDRLMNIGKNFTVDIEEEGEQSTRFFSFLTHNSAQ